MLALNPDAADFDIVDSELLPLVGLEERHLREDCLADQMLKSRHEQLYFLCRTGSFCAGGLMDAILCKVPFLGLIVEQH